MREKRKDNKGRVLKDGEQQRQDGRYVYRYTAPDGKRQSLYAGTLQELREKEAAALQSLRDGLDYHAGSMTVANLVDRYLAQKRDVRVNTQHGYDFVKSLLKKEEFGHRAIRDIKVSDAKLWFLDLRDRGLSYNTVCSIRGVVRPAFQMAVDDDLLRKNPFSFYLKDVLRNDTVSKSALSPEEVESFLEFVQDDIARSKHYDEIVILLETGLRVSELCGLTMDDIDFANRRITVDRQLLRTKKGKYYIEYPKTKSGKRIVPMSNTAYFALKRTIQNRKKPKKEYVVDGHKGFLFLDMDEKPKIALHLQHALKRITNNYNEAHNTNLRVTPHILRHTFCTNLANQGYSVKSLQYIMGHADAYTTMNIYAHSSYEQVEKEFLAMTANG